MFSEVKNVNVESLKNGSKLLDFLWFAGVKSRVTSYCHFLFYVSYVRYVCNVRYVRYVCNVRFVRYKRYKRYVRFAPFAF